MWGKIIFGAVALTAGALSIKSVSIGLNTNTCDDQSFLLPTVKHTGATYNAANNFYEKWASKLSEPAWRDAAERAGIILCVIPASITATISLAQEIWQLIPAKHDKCIPTVGWKTGPTSFEITNNREFLPLGRAYDQRMTLGIPRFTNQPTV